ncbi:MAG: Long-chain-fatty-acid--CoA ligase, partial [uncultured Ramlibacter sp.]
EQNLAAQLPRRSAPRDRPRAVPLPDPIAGGVI